MTSFEGAIATAPTAPTGGGVAAAVPPHSVDAEQAVLGAILLSEKAHYTYIVEEALKPGDFYVRRHRPIFEAMLALFESGGQLDALSVVEQLKTMGTLTEAGGPDAVGELVTAVPAVGQHPALRGDRQADLAPAPAARRLLPDPAVRLGPRRRGARHRRRRRAHDPRDPHGRRSAGVPARERDPARGADALGRALARGPLDDRRRVGLRRPRRDHRRLPARQPDHPRCAPVDGQVRVRDEHRRERRARQGRPRPVALFSLEMSEAELAQRFIASQAASRATTCARAACATTSGRACCAPPATTRRPTSTSTTPRTSGCSTSARRRAACTSSSPTAAAWA